MLHSRQLLDKGRFNVRLLRTSFYTGFVLLCASALALAGCGRDGEDRIADGTEQGQNGDDGPEDTPPSSAADTGDVNAADDPDASAGGPRQTQLQNPIANLVRPQACVTSRAGGLRPARGASSVADAAEVDILVRAIRSGDLTAIFDASNSVRARSISSEGTLPIHAAIDSRLPLAVWDLARLGSPLNPVDAAERGSLERVLSAEPPLARSLDAIELPWSRLDAAGRTMLAQFFAAQSVDSFVLRIEPQIQGEGPIITKNPEESRELLELALTREIFVLFLLQENPACFLVWADEIADRAAQANWTRTFATLALYDPALTTLWTPVRIDYEFWDQVFRSWLHTPEYRDVVTIEAFVELLGPITATFGPVQTSDAAVNRSIADLSRQTGAAAANALFVALQTLQTSAIARPNGPRSHQRAIVHRDDVYLGDEVVGYRVVQAPHPFASRGEGVYELEGESAEAIVHYDTRSARSDGSTVAASAIGFQFLPTAEDRVPRIGGRPQSSVLVTARRRRFIPGAEGIATVSLGSLATSSVQGGGARTTSVYREAADAGGPVVTYARALVETELYATPEATSRTVTTLAPGQNAAVVEARLRTVIDDEPSYWYLLRNDDTELGWAHSDSFLLLPLDSWPPGALAAALGEAPAEVGPAEQ